MSRFKNRKFNTVVLSQPAVIATDDGRVVRANAGDTILTDQATGKVTVKSPAMMLADTEVVSGVTRDKSPLFTSQPLTAPATVTPASDGLVQHGSPGDLLVTNTLTGEVRIVRPSEYAQQYE